MKTIKSLMKYILLAVVIIFIGFGIVDRLYLGNRVNLGEILLSDWLPLLSAFILGLLWKRKVS